MSAMRYLLNLGYALFLLVLSPWFAYKALTTHKYRAGFGQKFLGLVPSLPPPTGPRFWFHAVSVGEVRALSVVFDEIRRRDRRTRFEHQRAQSALAEFLRRPAAGDAGADDDRVVRRWLLHGVRRTG